jgi:hypothetical protein
MRGSDERTGSLFSPVDLDARVRRDHPLRSIQAQRNRSCAVPDSRRSVDDDRHGLTHFDEGHTLDGKYHSKANLSARALGIR